IALLVVSIYVNYRSEDFEFLLYLRGKMSMMVYVSALGLVLFFINLIFSGLDARTNSKEKAALEQEVNALKAKMFDLQEATSSKRHESTAVPTEADNKSTSEADSDDN
ncbi:hypothetical protein, partial [Fulvivirga lutimaris]|uniref:hypothetical protein n=1 Tax=Fulvivirga lutimaris TaxID=1819566 RepID=UPI00162980EF